MLWSLSLCQHHHSLIVHPHCCFERHFGQLHDLDFQFLVIIGLFHHHRCLLPLPSQILLALLLPPFHLHLLHRFHHFFIRLAYQRLTLDVVTNRFLSDFIATFEIVILVTTTQTHWLPTSDAFEDLPFVGHDLYLCLYLDHVMMWFKFSPLLKFDPLDLIKFDLLYTLCVSGRNLN